MIVTFRYKSQVLHTRGMVFKAAVVTYCEARYDTRQRLLGMSLGQICTAYGGYRSYFLALPSAMLSLNTSCTKMAGERLSLIKPRRCDFSNCIL